MSAFSVISFTKKQSKLQRPLPLNTVEMLKQASIRLKMGPHETMVIAENLYLFLFRQMIFICFIWFYLFIVLKKNYYHLYILSYFFSPHLKTNFS